jgi:archaellum component FlaC
MKLFKGKKESNKPVNLQDLQHQFNQVMFELGGLQYRKSMIKQELARLDSGINTLTQKADRLGEDAAKVKAKMEEEVKAKVKEGEVKSAESV